MKRRLLVLVLVIFLLIYFVTPLRHYLTPENVTRLSALLRSQGPWAPLAFAVLYVLAAVLASPGSVLTVASGLLFGTWLGALVSLSGATVGASCCFLLSRYLGRDTIHRLLHGREHLQGWDERIGRHGFHTVLYLRLVPLFPFNLLNYSLGLTAVRFRDYVAGSLVGMAPATFVFSSFGAAGQHASLVDPATWMQYQVWGPFLLILALAFLPKLAKRLPVNWLKKDQVVILLISLLLPALAFGDGSLVYRQQQPPVLGRLNFTTAKATPIDALPLTALQGPLATIGLEILYTYPVLEGAQLAVAGYSLQEPHTTRILFKIPRGDFKVIAVTSLVPAIAGTSVVVVVAYFDGDPKTTPAKLFKAFKYDEGLGGIVEEIYTVSGKGKNFRVEAVDWSLANDIYFYEFFDEPVRRTKGETVRLTVYPRAAMNLSRQYGIAGRPSIDPAGKRVVFLTGPVEEKGLPYHLTLLSLESGKKETLYERFGTRQITLAGEPTMWTPPPVWLRDEQHLVWVDTDRSVEIPPNLVIWDVAGKKPKKEIRVGGAGEGIAARLGWDDRLYVLIRESGAERYSFFQVDSTSGAQKNLITFPVSVAIVGMLPD